MLPNIYPATQWNYDQEAEQQQQGVGRGTSYTVYLKRLKCKGIVSLEQAVKNCRLKVIGCEDSAYPARLRTRDFLSPPTKIWAIGDIRILRQKLLGFFCSAKCPGDIILKTYDLARSWRDTGVGVIGGFHSPMEKECLDFLLRGKQPLVICPARGIENMRIPKIWRKSLVEDRLLVVSPFSVKYRRPTVALGMERNAFVAALADELFIPYAQPGGKVAGLVQKAISVGKKMRKQDLYGR
ncbi:MAG: DNA-processing protein DprA [Desulfobulbaceae bacterium]|nr:DNA-processing protein DprA [Desulfobulbaceae bacterium]